jgi:chromosome segregation ATPase
MVRLDRLLPMDNELQALQQQLEEARDEAELNLLQLQQVQEELEFYFLRCQELERELSTAKEATPAAEPQVQAAAPSDIARTGELEALRQSLADVERRRAEEQQLLGTAKAMLEGQARYLEDVSLREERAAQANDRLQLLEAEILYYLSHSKPLASLNPERINRLIQLAKQPQPGVRP